ncbi:hypothetical protein [Aliiroseovarius sediminis]|uniref:hypothetical protein n=1 Tax=Aliiroseovarius sediminis TaxID=2925839 RepID=UPI001F58E87A|nr:hypothetical protein [Aliiroseovarius sediminis]MCI2395584.1 hypothetical protein [Aliiroseovarius sediminis]
MDRFFYTFSTILDSTPAITYQRIDGSGWLVGAIEIYHNKNVILREASDRFPLSIGIIDPDDLADFNEGDYWGREICEEEYNKMWDTLVGLGLNVVRTGLSS